MTAADPANATVLAPFEKFGLLLQSDGRLPSVAGIVVGAPVTGSWWGHPMGQEIYRVAQWLSEHPDALLVKLVSGKITYVHRRLWGPLLKVVRAGEPWQIDGLTHGARQMLERVNREGVVSPEPPRRGKQDSRVKEAVFEVEARLLVHSQSVHTDGGAHAKQLESWEYVARRLQLKTSGGTVAVATSTLESAVAGLAPGSPLATLPWTRVGGRLQR